MSAWLFVYLTIVFGTRRLRPVPVSLRPRTIRSPICLGSVQNDRRHTVC